MNPLFFLAILYTFSLEGLAYAPPSEYFLTAQKFADEVGGIQLNPQYRQLVSEKGTALLLENSNRVSQTSQFLLLVDRNPNAQTASLAFFDAEVRTVTIVGSTKTSTGNPKRVGYYETPVGIFKNSPEHMSYRALGTKNDKGWRGLGVKGSRVWDLGWQETAHPKGGSINIRPLVHATDPDFGEPRLGKPDSKGCIRIPAKLNRFLDYYAILDAEYEKSEKGRRVLLKNREPMAMSGSLIVVIDSRN